MDRLARTIREQVALGRLLALGGPGDAVWITERAAVGSLRAATAAVPDVRLGEVSLALDAHDPDSAPDLPAAAPVGALPHVPVRVRAAFEAAVTEPLPLAAERLRTALLAAAEDGLGMAVAAVDLRITGLLEDGQGPGPAETVGPWPEDPAEPGPAIVQGTTESVAAAARAVPGVLRLTRRLPGYGAGVRVHDTEPPPTPTPTPTVGIGGASFQGPGGAAAGAGAAGGPTNGPFSDPGPDPGPDPGQGPGPGSGGSAGAGPGAEDSPNGAARGPGSGPGPAAEGRGAGAAARERLVQVQIAVGSGHMPLAVAREVASAVRAAAARDAPGPVTAAVVVTDTIP